MIPTVLTQQLLALGLMSCFRMRYHQQKTLSRECWLVGPWCLHERPTAAVTNYQAPGGLKLQRFILSHSGGWKFGIQVLAGPPAPPPPGSEEGSAPASSRAPGTASLPRLVVASLHSSRTASLHLPLPAVTLPPPCGRHLP